MAVGPAKELKEPNDWQTVPAEPNDWQDVAPPHPAQETTGQKIAKFGTDALKGLGESAVGLMSTGNHAVRKIPGIGEWLTTPITGTPADEAIAHTDQLAKPVNSTQSFAKGVGDAAQFLIPGGAEEKAVSMVPKAFKTAAKIGASALGAGAVNKAQGGSFGAGVAMGGIGTGITEGLKAAAPGLARSAMGIRKIDNAYGRNPGRAILDETKGIRAGTIAESAQGKLDELNPQLEKVADAASVRPAPRIKGFLQAPQEEIPLHSSPAVEGKLSKPIVLNQTDRATKPLLQSPSLQTPLSEKVDIFPNQIGHADTNIRSAFDAPAQGLGHAEYIGGVAGERGGPGQVQGVFRPRSEMSASIPPALESNPAASIRPARGILSGEMNKAGSQNAEGLHGQLNKMFGTLSHDFRTGEEIPENLTARQMLNLKRGFDEEHLGWNPEIHDRAVGAGRRAYGAMNSELKRVAPDAEPLLDRISNLIPVARRAKSTELNAPLSQRLLNRVGAHTGALTGAIGGGALGYREGGLPKALEYGTIGLVAPELLASPEGKMMMARTFNSPANAKIAKALTGGALVATHKEK